MMTPELPLATYRLQLHGGFGFDDAAARIPYLASLGITHLYASPFLKARSGSMHGYDISDHNTLNPELGGSDGFERLSSALEAHQMGLILDFVPNHMGVEDARANPWWWDVLANGTGSPFARCFDIDWDPIKSELKGRVLLPVLGDQYGIALERGELMLAFENGEFIIRYFDRAFPINPRSVPGILKPVADALTASDAVAARDDARSLHSIVTSLVNLPPRDAITRSAVLERDREQATARERLADLAARAPHVRTAIEAQVGAMNGRPGTTGSFDALHALLERQPYRLAYWRTAFHEINYRRFFDINELASLRMEDPDVFADTHRFVLRLVAERKLAGLRLDHLDGLSDPAGYLTRLHEALTRVRGESAGPFHVVIEKILGRGERLREWQMHGTTGYEALADIGGLFVDPEGLHALQVAYRRFTGRHESFADTVYESKRAVIDSTLASEVNVLADALNRISEDDRRSRDFTLNSLRTMLREVIACFPVYRTYLAPGETAPEDVSALETAVMAARVRNPGMDPSIFVFLQDVMLERIPAEARERERRRQFAMSFQQVTAPVQAKGVEDTTFYRYHPLASLNDVGCTPSSATRTPQAFHEASSERQRYHPYAMVCTATHDTKRGEDTRLRMHALSEMSAEWSRNLSAWTRLHAPSRTRVGEAWAPDRNDESLFYQTLVGVWPRGNTPSRGLVERMIVYMRKAIREAKVHTSWIAENAEYERAVERYVESVLSGRRTGRFLQSFLPVQERAARIGAVHSLAQVVLKITGPGVPDLYQGTEDWDLSLVDPDNRGPVDFEMRATALEALEPVLDGGAGPAARRNQLASIVAGWPDARIKLLLTAAALRYRRSSPWLADGPYLPLDSTGAHAGRVVAFSRSGPDRKLIVVVPRLAGPLSDAGLPLGQVWDDTAVVIPGADSGTLRDVLTGATLEMKPADAGAVLAMADVFAVCPVAMLEWTPALQR